MLLSDKASKELRDILQSEMDPVSFELLNEQMINELGVSLLRLARIARTTLARAEKYDLSIQARGGNPLEPNTSVREHASSSPGVNPVRGL